MAALLSVDVIGTLPRGFTKKAVVALATAAYENGEAYLAARRPARARRTAPTHALRPAELSVSLVSDAKMRRLNNEHRGKDKTTDVLSFGFTDGLAVPMPDGIGTKERRQLGDIFISLPQVQRQARAIDRPIAQEFALMVAHGTLHLLGFDHASLKQEKEMFALQHDILSETGYF